MSQRQRTPRVHKRYVSRVKPSRNVRKNSCSHPAWKVHIYTCTRNENVIHACRNAREILLQRAEFVCAMTHIRTSASRTTGRVTHIRTARARNRRAWSTDRDDGECGRLRRRIGIYRLGVSRLSNAQRIRVRVRVWLVSCRTEAQAEAQHQQRHRADQQVTRPGHRALPWNRWHPSVIDSTIPLRRNLDGDPQLPKRIPPGNSSVGLIMPRLNIIVACTDLISAPS